MNKSTRILLGALTLVLIFVTSAIVTARVQTDRIIREHRTELTAPIPPGVWKKMDPEQRKMLDKVGLREIDGGAPDRR